MVAFEALEDLDTEALAALVADIGIPPRPSLLADMQAEVQRDEPRLRVMANIAGGDVAMSAALLKTANSPFMGLRKRAETVQEAFTLLGYDRCHVILTELTLRDLFPPDNTVLARFWDVSTKRAHAMTHLARHKRISSPALAHTFGLFVDIGLPVLLKRFSGGTPSYQDTLALANESSETFTKVERAQHQTDHAVVGALMSRSWGVSQTVQLATRLHHDYSSWAAHVPASVRELMAVCLVSEHIIQRYQGLNRHSEWEKGGAKAMDVLGVDALTIDGWCDEVHDLYNQAG
jgi:HD-like signal output (HDOD) protein